MSRRDKGLVIRQQQLLSPPTAGGDTPMARVPINARGSEWGWQFRNQQDLVVALWVGTHEKGDAVKL